MSDNEPPGLDPESGREENPFWEFSLDVYAAPGVATECLRLQDEFDADVNVLLFCGWLGWQRRIELVRADIDAIVAATDDWQANAVSPLRTARRYAKIAATGEFYRLVASVELAAERCEQDQLFALSKSDWMREGRGQSRAALSGNIGLYLSSLERAGASGSTLCRLLLVALGSD